MYTVTCSSCNATDKALFARVGAVMVCTSCKEKVQLRLEDVKRQFKLKLDGDDELFRVPQVQRAEEPGVAAVSAPVAVAADEGMLEEEIHEDHAELAAEADRRADAARRRKPKAAPVVVKAGLSSGELAQHLAKKRQMKSGAILIGVAAAAILGIVILLSLAGGSGTNQDKDSAKDAAKDSSVVIDDPSKDAVKDAVKDGGSVALPTTDGLKDGSVAVKDGGAVVDPTKDKGVAVPVKPAIVRVSAMPLGIDSWQSVNEAHQAGAPPERVLLINDVREKQDGGGQVFKAEVTSLGVASALVSVTLVNDEDRVYARFERPYFLLDGKRPRPMQLTIPPELVGSTMSVCWQVTPIDTHVTNPTLLEDTLAEVLTTTAATDPPVIKISAYNSSSAQLKEAAFVIQGVDGTGEVASQWRLRLPQSIDARSWVKFEAELPPTEMKKYASWRVLGAGLPQAGAAVTPPVVTPDPKLPSGERNPEERPLPPRRRGLFDF